MQQSPRPKYGRTLLVGALMILAAGGLAWRSVQGPLEAPPMESLLESAPAEALAVKSDGETSHESEWDITVTRNTAVDTWIDFLTGRNHDRTRLWLERSGRYAELIRGELRARGMPQDLFYLALIESGFSPYARSSASAVGIWQFIAETGRRYGLEVSRSVDERRDPVRATHAALDYLQDLHERFGSWYLAAAAYNTGENRVDRILRQRARGARGDDSLFWTIAPHLPRETRNYVPLMLAAGHIAKDPAKYGFHDLEYHEPLAFETVWVPAEIRLADVAEAARVEADVIAELNPHLLDGRTPSGRARDVRVPVGRSETFAANFPEVYTRARLAKAETPETEQHRVRRGETLSHIAVRYGVSVNALRAANDGILPHRLRAGAVIRVPTDGATSPRVHRVASGESLWTIARRYSLSVRELRALNGLGGRSVIHPGQSLRVRG